MPQNVMRGEKSEQQLQDEFVKLVAGRIRNKQKAREKCDRLQYLWNTSYPHGLGSHQEPKDVEFRRRAKDEGFTDKQIDAFLALP